MTLRKPMVMNAGKLQQLQSGDTLDAAVTSYSLVSCQNSTSVAIVKCQPVYISASLQVKQSIATASASAYVFGLVNDASINAAASGYIQTDGIVTATSDQWAVMTSSGATLTPGSVYYLSTVTTASADRITKTAPTVASRYVTYLGIATSTVTLDISDMDKRGGILL